LIDNQEELNYATEEGLADRVDFTNVEIMASVVLWVLDIGHNRGKQNQYLCIIEI